MLPWYHQAAPFLQHWHQPCCTADPEQTHTLLGPRQSDTQFIGRCSLHQNLPNTIICFGSTLSDPQVGYFRPATPPADHTMTDSKKIVWFRQTLCFSARKTYIQFMYDYSLVLEVKRQVVLKWPCFLQVHPVSGAVGLSALQRFFI